MFQFNYHYFDGVDWETIQWHEMDHEHAHDDLRKWQEFDRGTPNYTEWIGEMG